MKTITIKRLYDHKTADGSYRILVDRLWPRGVRKIDLQIDEWNKEITPSPELRKWFDHKKERFEEFSRLYIQELMAEDPEINRVRSIAKNEDVTLLYGAKDPEINHAVILMNYLLK
ncbi:DUF488 family protein [Flavobacterium sp. LHD-85]|uniref:DUF488 domain-containing protein n=1 Tax=Flavobacterium sp. LHD-85 TaxID=3071410 RepID=UPI0027DF21B1|nr:DUF488 family protein [Flavobacterium sp. LHD-85]MDQ6532139.1 DUF488 family protein [Flavobacterium sp. LHD-85]